MKAIGAALLLLISWGCSQSAAEPTTSNRQSPSIDTSARDGRIMLRRGDHRSLLLPGGDRRSIESLLAISSPLKYGNFAWDDIGVPKGPAWVRIDLTAQTMSVFRGKHEIGTSVILYGADNHPTPRGRFPILTKLKDHRSSLYDAAMPFTLRLTGDGIAIHGSNVRYGAATHGCIGIPEAFAEHIFSEVTLGDPVYIMPQLNQGRRDNDPAG